MALQSVTQYPVGFDLAYNSQLSNLSLTKPKTMLQERPSSGSGIAGRSTNVSFEYYSSDKLTLNYSNKDGDTVTLNMEHVEYQKAMLSVGGNINSEDWNEIVDKIKEEFLKFQKNIIKKFIESIGGETVEESEKAEYGKIEGLPEYWNAENTSQRIVDFATSFYGLAESTGKEYYEMMRGAIEEGFSQAMGILGELTGPVNDLVNHTFELAMQKLDAWAVEQGIDIGEESAVAA